ncbi:DUF6059 family protein [Streptomyces sp. NPDC005820]|uniref:DUF6059 family protein n=1 Tax=Streptomyces sp. NPDC005820 TaxID=3157069 RepID=UPI0033CB987E
MRFLVARMVRAAYEALVAFGWLWLALPPPPVDEAGPLLAGPPRDHPERLCPGSPLTPIEQALERELQDRAQ